VHWQNATFANATLFPGEGGTMAEMGQLFTLYWTQAFADGMAALGKAPLLLARAGYAGTWRHGAALWSGDIGCSWSVLQSQLRLGLSAQTSGFGLWTTDIGGFGSDGPMQCDPSNSTYQELWVRWFQYGATCPVFRQHGSRATEIWEYGPQAEGIVAGIIRWRASMRWYVKQELAKMAATGRPVNRPLWWDFPQDAQAWQVRLIE
jgi:alpha-D-xyloside xylohydrolase